MDIPPRSEWEKLLFVVVMLMWPLGIGFVVWKVVAGETPLDGIAVIGEWVMEHLL